MKYQGLEVWCEEARGTGMYITGKKYKIEKGSIDEPECIEEKQQNYRGKLVKEKTASSQ